MFSQEAKLRVIQWKDEVNNKAYAETDSDAVRALCGKLETYLVRFCLVIQIMHGICGESGMNEIEPKTAELAIRLTEYFRNMESRIAPEIETGILDNRFTELLETSGIRSPRQKLSGKLCNSESLNPRSRDS